MKLDIVFKEMESTEGIKSKIEEKAKKLDRFVAPDDYVRVVVAANFKGQQHSAEIDWHDNRLGMDVHAKSEGHDLYKQIDEAIEKAYKQVKTAHERQTDSKRRVDPAKKISTP